MSDPRKLWYFQKVDLYELLCPHKLARFEETHTFHSFKKNAFIYLTNEPSKHIYLIAKGRIKLGSYSEDGREIVKAVLGPGELFGELALSGEEKRSDFAMALDNDTTVCPMSIEDMADLLQDNKTLTLKIFKLMGFRLRKTERRLESLVFKDARTRIIDFLVDQADEYGQKIGLEMKIENHYTHKDIASLTGTSRQTVTTILNELKTQNLINFNRKQILIRDLEALRQESLEAVAQQ